MSSNEGRPEPGAVRSAMTGRGRMRALVTLAVAGCAVAVFLTAVAGALATKSTGHKGDDRCVAGVCLKPYPLGYPHNADLGSILALPSPPAAREEVFYAHGTPAGATNVHPTVPFAFGEGSDIFATTGSGGLASWPSNLPRLNGLPPVGMFLFLLRDADDNPVGFGVEQEMFQVDAAGQQVPGAFASDWIVSIPGRGVLWLNSYESGGAIPDVTLPDGSVVRHNTSGPLKDGRGVIVGGSGEFAGRTGTWTDTTIRKPGFPALGNFEFELRLTWDAKPRKPRT